MTRRFLPALAASLVLACALPAAAHEFIVKPGKPVAAPGENLPVGVLSSHVFMVSEELEDAPDVTVSLKDASGVKEVALTPDAKTQEYKGSVTLAKPGFAVLVGHRLPQTWTKTPEGMKKGTKADFPGATVSNVYEKFAKTLVQVGAADDAWKKPLGQELEIMPLADPSGYKAGQEAQFRILYQGKPLSTEVFATCDGYTASPNSYAWYTETDDKGVAPVKFCQKGLWMVRVQHKAPGKDGLSEHVMRATLLFDVK